MHAYGIFWKRFLENDNLKDRGKDVRTALRLKTGCEEAGCWNCLTVGLCFQQL
jgi:hypothetical protein